MTFFVAVKHSLTVVGSWANRNAFDLIALVSVGLITAGLWLVSPALSLVVLGIIGLALSVLGATRGPADKSNR